MPGDGEPRIGDGMAIGDAGDGRSIEQLRAMCMGPAGGVGVRVGVQ